MYGQGRTRGQVSILGIEAATNQACAALVPGGRADPWFLFQFLTHSYTSLRALSNSAGQDNLSAAIISRFRILLPPLAEQRKIAQILLTWDDAIENYSALIAKTELKFAGLMADLFTPSTKHRNVALSELVASVKTKNSAGETNVLTSSGKRGLVSQTEYYKKSVAGADISGYYMLEQGDFAYNRSSSNGYPFGAIKRLERYTRGVLSTLYLCFRLDKTDEIDGDYLTHFFESGFLNRQLAAICQEGARSHGLLNVAQSDFFQLVVPVPDIERQRRIARTLNEAIAELELLERQRTAVNEQKRGLMQKLLTGEIRVSGEGATSSGEASIV